MTLENTSIDETELFLRDLPQFVQEHRERLKELGDLALPKGRKIHFAWFALGGNPSSETDVVRFLAYDVTDAKVVSETPPVFQFDPTNPNKLVGGIEMTRGQLEEFVTTAQRILSATR